MATIKLYPEVSATTMRTVSGSYIDLLTPDWRLINFGDIAHHLGFLNRWTGARRRQISVLEHSLRCGEIAPADLRLEALLHDAHEAYTGDIGSPMKNAIAIVSGQEGVIRAIQARLDVAIACSLLHRCALPAPESQDRESYVLAAAMQGAGVRAIDEQALHEEAADDLWPAERLLFHRLAERWISWIEQECRARYVGRDG